MCPHCSQNLSYSAFTAYKARYFDVVSLKWATDDKLGGPSAAVKPGFTSEDIDTPELGTQDLDNRGGESLCEGMDQEPSSPSMLDTQHSHGDDDDESQDMDFDTLSLSDQSSEGSGDQDREVLEVRVATHLTFIFNINFGVIFKQTAYA